VPFLLAKRAHSESARSMRAVKGSLGHSLQERHKIFGRHSPGQMARPGVPVGGRVRNQDFLSSLNSSAVCEVRW
jgi:hypothetical protein